jgi:hypothetical protein
MYNFNFYTIVKKQIKNNKIAVFSNKELPGFRIDSCKMSGRIFNVLQQIMSYKSVNEILIQRYREQCAYVRE